MRPWAPHRDFVMYKLIVKLNQQTVTEHVFDQGTVSIGRNADNDVCLDDPTVSGLHAKIISFFRPTYIQDQRSTNGTFVNGKRVTEQALQAGDVITVGTHKMVYEPDVGNAVRKDTQTTMVLSDADLRKLNQTEDS